MNVGLRALRIFFSVGRHESFSRAAAEFGLSQSAVSLSVRHLEAEMGVTLLDRTTRRVWVTPAGEILLASAQRVVEELDGILRDLHDDGQRRRGRVMLACVPAVARSVMPRCIIRCRDRLPEVEIAIDDCPAVQVLRKVAAGEVAFGIASGHIGRDDLVGEALMSDPFCLVCRHGDAFAASPSARWSALEGQRLIMLDNTSGSRQVIEATLAATQVSVQVVLELAQPSSVLGMVEAGVGIAIVPALAAPRADDTALVTVPLTHPKVSRTILLVRRRDRSLSPAAAAVWAELLDAGPPPAPSRRSKPSR